MAFYERKWTPFTQGLRRAAALTRAGAPGERAPNLVGAQYPQFAFEIFLVQICAA
jgi:hypothetical protein